MDPRPNPSVSSYACFGNNPVIFSDMAGDTIKIVGDVDFVANTKSYLNQLYLTERGKKMIDELEKSEKIFTIKEAMNFTSTSYNDEDGTVKYDPTPWIESLDGGCYNGLIGLAHEIRHAYQDLHFQIQKRQNGSYKNRKELEADAVGFANYIRSVYSLGDLRYKYSGLGQLFPKGTTDKQFNPQNEKITITKKYIDIKPVLSSGTVHSDNMRSVIQIHSTILWNYTKTIDEKTEDGGVKRVTNNVKGEPVKSFNSEVTLF